MARPVRAPNLHCSESDFQHKVMSAAAQLGWRTHAERRAIIERDDEGKATVVRTPIEGHRGWPDIQLVHRQHGFIVAELKSAKGQLGVGQPEWLDDLAVWDFPGSPMLVELWRPQDWPYIEVALRDGLDVYRARYRKPRITVPGSG